MKSLPALTSFRNRAMLSFYVEWYVKSTWLNGITLPVIVIYSKEIVEVKQDTTALILLSIAEGSPDVVRKAMA
jgi:hypothetical protein